VLLGADVDARCGERSTALIWAAGRGHLPTVKMLCELGADVHVKSSSGSTALHAAVMKHGSAGERAVCEVVHALVELGASVHVQDHLGRTPLHWSALSRSAEAAELCSTLVDLGASVFACDRDEFTPLCRAAFCGNSQVVRMLFHLEKAQRLDRGAQPMHGAADDGLDAAIIANDINAAAADINAVFALYHGAVPARR